MGNMSTATDMLAAYIAAETAILSGQSYKWGERQLTRADLAQVIAGRQEWERKCASEARGGNVGVQLANFTGRACGPEAAECSWGRN